MSCPIDFHCRWITILSYYLYFAIMLMCRAGVNEELLLNVCVSGVSAGSRSHPNAG